MSNAASPAMPQTEYQHNDAGEYIAETRGGLTKREHFAAMVMQGLLSGDVEGVMPIDLAARLSVQHADALLEELDKYYD